MQYARHTLTHWPQTGSFTQPVLTSLFLFPHTSQTQAHTTNTFTQILYAKTTYSTEAGGSRGAGRSRHSGLAGDTISSSGASGTLQVGKETEKGNIRNLELLECRRATEQVQNHTSVHNLATWSAQLFVYDDESSVYIHRMHKCPPAVISIYLCDEGAVSLSSKPADQPVDRECSCDMIMQRGDPHCGCVR